MIQYPLGKNLAFPGEVVHYPMENAKASYGNVMYKPYYFVGTLWKNIYTLWEMIMNPWRKKK